MLRLPSSLLLSLALHAAAALMLRSTPGAVNAVQGAQAKPAVMQVVVLQWQAPPPAVPPVVAEPAPVVVLPQAAVPLRQPPMPRLRPVPPRRAVAASPAPVQPTAASATLAAVRTDRREAVEAKPLPAAQEKINRTPAFLAPPAPPSYPVQARRRNQQGTVLLEVRLDEQGRQRDLQVLRSSGVASLDQSALKAVAAWRFRPETESGRAIPSRVHIPVQFALTASR
ncbi:MAG: energy transducer TonB [Pseudomonadota bacterium]